MSPLTRDHFLKLLAAGGVSFLGLDAVAQNETPHQGPPVPWGRLKFIGENGNTTDWHVHPHGDINLIDSIRDTTSTNLEKKWNIADVSDLPSMIEYPFLFMHAEIAPVLDDAMRTNMREYFLRGGFLFAEDCVNGYGNKGWSKYNDFFFRGIMDELPKILPEAKIEQLSPDHPLFHCFFDFDAWPHMQGSPHGAHGVTLNGRLVALISPSDLHCAWTNGAVWFGREKQKKALQMGTNIYLYAMTQK